MTPAEFFSKSIKGTIMTTDLTFTDEKGRSGTMTGEEYDFIEILEKNNKKLYVINQWYDEFKNEPLFIVEDLVLKVSLR